MATQQTNLDYIMSQENLQEDIIYTNPTSRIRRIHREPNPEYIDVQDQLKSARTVDEIRAALNNGADPAQVYTYLQDTLPDDFFPGADLATRGTHLMRFLEVADRRNPAETREAIALLAVQNYDDLSPAMRQRQDEMVREWRLASPENEMAYQKALLEHYIRQYGENDGHTRYMYDTLQEQNPTSSNNPIRTLQLNSDRITDRDLIDNTDMQEQYMLQQNQK